MGQKKTPAAKYPSQFAIYLRSWWREATSFRLLFRRAPNARWEPTDYTLAVGEVLDELPAETATRAPLSKSDARDHARRIEEIAKAWASDLENRTDFTLEGVRISGEPIDKCEKSYRYDPKWDDSEDEDTDGETDPRSVKSETVAIMREAREMLKQGHANLKTMQQIIEAHTRSTLSVAEQAAAIVTQFSGPMLELQREQMKQQAEHARSAEFNATLRELGGQYAPAATMWAQAQYVRAHQETEMPDAVDDHPIRTATINLVQHLTMGDVSMLSTALGKETAAVLQRVLDECPTMDIEELKAAASSVATELQSALSDGRLEMSQLRHDIVTAALQLQQAIAADK